MRTLEKFKIMGFKSIRDQTLALGQLNVFIGGNGVGKSNLIGAFRFLREIVNKNLAGYTLTKSGADTLLHFGQKQTPKMSFRLEFGEGQTSNTYEVSLHGTDDDSLIIASEWAYYHNKIRYPTKPYERRISSTTKESQLKQDSHISARQVVSDLESYRVYHFHDTSDTAAVKAQCEVEDNRVFKPQADNLAAFLYWMQQKEPNHFANIQDTIRQIAPFFDEFRLAPSRLNEGKIRLEWHEKGADSDAYFNAHALSDGTLRFICLATLLMQPELPRLLLLDEPELGLHPAAVTLLADLLKSAAIRTQVIVATQSVTLVNQFGPEDIWTVEHEQNQSTFRRLSTANMSGWLDDYSIGDLWEKNQIGARP